ncbi:5'/3'-nucleotidase SurE [Herpetosiphon llansteffanensis]|uniref:5'/3'-nucleotidase SurE n=1 Tax=Herpetosiphon llansteffanensis TaxID=2094568 RepID=UPI000D7BFBC1|nr:5'/3'-nucleotidase SurE [Herpetosiphon llansteffanensis]
MNILLSNDDGVHSPGLLALKGQLEQLGRVTVVAPERNWSAGSHSRTLFAPLRINEVQLADGSPALACDGSPADCVGLALLGVLDHRPDLVVSGINLGANLGHDVLYSGTVAAAMEGLVVGIRSIAISLVDGYKPDSDFSVAATWARRIVASAMELQLPSDILLNVNVPQGSAEIINDAKVTRLGHRIYRDELIKRLDPRGRPYYWVGGAAPEGKPDDGTDFGAVANNHVSITPLHFDMTNLDWVQRLSTAIWNNA